MREKTIADMSRLEFTESESEDDDDDDGNDGFKADSDDEFSNPLAMRNDSSDKTSPGSPRVMSDV